MCIRDRCGAGSSPSEAGQIGTNASGPNSSRQRGDQNGFDLQVDRSKEGTLIVTLIRTSESPDHGILEVDWEKREVAVTHLVRIAENKYVIVSQDGYTETKAPLGAWNVKDDSLPVPFVHQPVGAILEGTRDELVRSVEDRLK